jgi:hypothetical protein
LKSILAREIHRIERLPDLPRPLQLDIAFDPSCNACIHRFRGETPDRRLIVDWKLYRVAIVSQIKAVTRVKIEHLKLAGGDDYSNLFLRVMGDPTVTEFTLHPGDPHFWDVVEKPEGSDWVRITHAVRTLPSLLKQVPFEFKLTASCDQGSRITKLVELTVDRSNNNELRFRVIDA